MKKTQYQATQWANRVALLAGEMTAKCMAGEWEAARVLGWKLVEASTDYLAFCADQRNRKPARPVKLVHRSRTVKKA